MIILVDETESFAINQKTKEISKSSALEQELWLEEMGDALQTWGDIEDKTVMAQAQILYNVWSVWDVTNNPERVSILDEAKTQWGYDFMVWAKSFTKRRALREPADETITNKITVYRDWKAQELIEYPEHVYLPPRDNKGRILEGEYSNLDNWEQVEFDPADCDYGKLLVARGAAKRGDMTPEAWSALRDPHSTVAELKSALIGKADSNSPDDEAIFYDNGIIYGYQDGKKVAVLQSLFENSSDPLFNKTLTHILRAAGISVPAEIRQ